MQKSQVKEKQMDSSNFSERSLEDSSSQNLQEESTNCCSLNRHDLTFISSKAPKSNLKSNSRFIWESKFSKNTIVNILETNFQSMKVQIHLGNYKLITNVILTKIKQQELFCGNLIGSGVFGKVYLLNYQNFQYAIKVIKIKSGTLEWGTLQFYKEYFLYCLADELNVGPQIYSLFGYDVVFLKNAAFFVMEKCVRKKFCKSDQIQTDLNQALDILHANNIVHLDLKPQNISYSQKRQKYVFLDFGLSKIIKEEIGEKTLTRFLGTLSYCSEEMKKCYILQHQLPIDLYKNDKFCLNKTLDQLIALSESKESERSKGAVNRKNKMSQDEGKQRKIVVESVVLVLNLKFHIFKINIPQVLSSLLKCSSLPRTCYQIFQSKNIKQEYLSFYQIQELVKGLKNQVCSNQINFTKTDIQVSGFFNQSGILEIFQECIPITQILKANSTQFKILMECPEWVVKIFKILDPLEEGFNFQGKDVSSVRNQIIEKIYQSYQKTNTNVRFPNFICFKTEYAVHFFYQKLKDSKNVKFLISLRIMFLATMTRIDQKLIKQIESDILNLTQQENEKILRIISFYLVWCLLNCFLPFEHPSLFQNIASIKAKNNQERSQIERNLCQLLVIITSNQSLCHLQLQEQRKFAYISKKVQCLIWLNDNLSWIQLVLDIKNLCSLIGDDFKQYVSDYKTHCSYSFLVYVTINKNTYVFNPAFERWRNIEGTYIRFELEHQKYKNDDNYFSNYDNFVEQSEYGLNQFFINKFLPCIQNRSDRILKLAQMFFHENFTSFSENRKIVRFLCIGSVILSLIEQNLQLIEMDRYLTTRTQLIQARERIRSDYCQIRKKWGNTQMQTFFQIKSFSLQIRLARSEEEKERAKQNLALLFNKSTFKIKEIGAIGTIFVELEHHLLQKKDASLIKLFEDVCDTLINQKLQLFIYERRLLLLFLKIKKETGNIKECLRLLTFIISNLECGCLMNMRSSIKTGRVFLSAYNAFIPFLPNYVQITIFQFVKRVEIKSVHIEFLLFYLSRQAENLINFSESKEIHKRTVKSIQKIGQVYLRSAQVEIYKEAIRLELYKNEKQHRLFFKRCIILLDSYEKRMITKSICMVNKIQNKQIKNRLLQKYDLIEM